jgi:hypothetical protein
MRQLLTQGNTIIRGTPEDGVQQIVQIFSTALLELRRQSRTQITVRQEHLDGSDAGKSRDSTGVVDEFGRA